MEELRKNVNTKLSIKMRIGFKGEKKALEISKLAEENGFEYVTIHGRTREQMYAGTADWEEIKKVKESVKIKVIANGGIKTPQDIIKILDYTGADAIMIGRAALGRPWFFKDALKLLSGESIDLTKKTNVSLLFETLFEHIELEKKIYDDYTAVRELRKHIPYYLKDLPESGRVKDNVNKAKSIKEVLLILHNYKNTFF